MRLNYYILFIFSTVLIFLSCSPTRNLKENQYLLYNQSIKGNKEVSRESLYPFYKQKPNRRIFGIMPFVSIYNLGKRHHDTTKIKNEINIRKHELDTLVSIEKDTTLILSRRDSLKHVKMKSKLESKLDKLNLKYREGNWLMRAPGEPPVIFDSSLVNQTRDNMEYYLKSKGYFQSDVSTNIDTTRKKINITYQIKEGRPYKVKNVRYEIKDPVIDSIVKAHIPEALIRPNDNYDESNLTGERERLNKLLKNYGYYDFNRQYILAQVDTNQYPGKAEIYFSINNPKQGLHTRYTIEKIIFNTDISNRPFEKRDTNEYRGIYYVYYSKRFSKKILNDKSRLRVGELYNQQNVQATQMHLASLDYFKFININFEKNADTSKKSLTAYVRTSPFHRNQISDEWGMNVGQGFVPGPYASLTFKRRNFFRSFEVFETTLRYSLEAVLSQNQNNSLQTVFLTEYGGTFSLIFPKVFFIDASKRLNDHNVKTKINTGFNFVSRPEYTRSMLRTNLNFSWQRSLKKSFSINLLDINIIKTPFKSGSFSTFLQSNPSLALSFSNSLVTSFNAFYTYNDYNFNVIKKSKYFRPFVEIGGNAVNLISRAISKDPGNELLGLQYFQFIKLNTDLRFYMPTSRKNMLAVRFFAGYARPYGNAVKNGNFSLPYDKYYFTGGPSSIRAWKPRRLGPGSFLDPVNGYRFEQPGNIIFESNYEWRFHVFKYLESALFIDAGNIWTSNFDPKRPGSQFKFNTFLSQIAVGTGVGLRFNFTFLILRFDYGIKVWDPGQKGFDRLALLRLGSGGQTLLNIGIGYPF